MSNRIIADPTEAVWRADWAKHWAYARDAGWTDTARDSLGNEMEFLRDDVDCTKEMGRGVAYDWRHGIARLQQIGTIRGWLSVSISLAMHDADGNPLLDGDACRPCGRGRHSKCRGCLCACSSVLKSIDWAVAR